MNLRLIPSLEKSPVFVAHAQRPAGRWLLLATFGLLLWPLNSAWPVILGFLVLTTALPRHRRWIVSGCGIVAAVLLPNPQVASSEML